MRRNHGADSLCEKVMGVPMKTVSLASFLVDADALVRAAAIDEDALRIDTGSGSAVLISEAEWLVLRDGLKLALGASDAP